MKSKKLKKAFSVFTASLMLSCVMPAFNVSAEDTVENIITNSTFDTSTADWGIYKESGGNAALSTDNGRLAMHITSTGKVNYAVQMYYDIVPLYKNGVYHISYEISSDVDRQVEVMLQQNGGTYQSYTWKGLNLTSEPQKIDYEFTMEADTDIMSKFVFNCGKYEGEELGEHTIYLDNVVLELIDDSQVDYSEIRAYEPPITVNQLGYKPDDIKKAVIRVLPETDNIKTCSVVNEDTQEVVFEETIDESKMVNNISANEYDYIFDFSSITEEGKYYITCSDIKDPSYTFEISENPYGNLIDDTVKMLYLQRCGTEIQDETFGHKECHNTDAIIYGTDEKTDVSGGWHDAGDYGRYVVAGAKAVADLMYAYDANPELYGDDTGIPESGNGVPDILDEVRYELEWMLKMQDSDGGVHHKVTCETFPGYVMPEQEIKPLVVTPVSTTATADFCASMAMAYEFYKDINSDFAEKCLASAEKAWGFLNEHPEFIFKDQEDITTGAYGDTSDIDERYWAAAQMYRATGNASYIEGIKQSKGLDWSTVGDYGNIAVLTMDGIDKESDIYKNAEISVIAQADNFVKLVSISPYGSPVTKYNWGSNMTIANAGIILGLAGDITGNKTYNESAKEVLNYLLGRNPNGVCFVTGYGTVSPQNPHHRPSMAKQQAMKGMLVGGVNSSLEDSAAKAYLKGVAPAKCYVDNWESYSTNEITIYWNSPLTYLLSLTNKTSNTEQNLPGDVTVNGKVDVADVVAAAAYVSDPENNPVENQGLKNGDVHNTGDGITGNDVLMIQQYLASIITEL